MTLTAEDIVQKLKDEFKDKIKETFIKEREEGHLKKVIQKAIWITVERDDFYKTVKFLHNIDPLHVSCPMASRIYDESIHIIYIFTIFGGYGNHLEIPISIKVNVPKQDFRVPTLTDIIPGIIFMERETIEMLGVKIDNIPDDRPIFTPDLSKVEEGMKPLRTDLKFGFDDYHNKRKQEKNNE